MTTLGEELALVSEAAKAKRLAGKSVNRDLALQEIKERLRIAAAKGQWGIKLFFAEEARDSKLYHRIITYEDRFALKESLEKEGFLVQYYGCIMNVAFLRTPE